MQRHPLASNAVRTAGYDPASQTLELEFATGRIYRYTAVPQSVYDWLLRARSKGAYVARMISPNYEFADISPKPEPIDLLAQLQATIATQSAVSDRLN